MKDYIEERVLELAGYIIETGSTVRAAAKKFKISKSTVHKDITERLKEINPALASEVKAVLDNNKAEHNCAVSVKLRNISKIFLFLLFCSERFLRPSSREWKLQCLLKSASGQSFRKMRLQWQKSIRKTLQCLSALGLWRNSLWQKNLLTAKKARKKAESKIIRILPAAKKAGLTVSCDINYRSKLWSAQKARPIMTEIMKYVDVCIGNEEDAEIVFGIKAGTTDVTKGQLDTDGYKKSLQTVAETFGCKIVAYSQRKSYSASDNGWSGIIYDDEKKQVYTSAQYDIRITDRIGGGDAFASGLIYALHNNISPENAIETAAAAGCLDQTLEGDFCLFGINEVFDLANGDSSGRVKR